MTNENECLQSQHAVRAGDVAREFKIWFAVDLRNTLRMDLENTLSQIPLGQFGIYTRSGFGEYTVSNRTVDLAQTVQLSLNCSAEQYNLE